jgi:oligosaccharide repeat unit polymerase
MGGLIGFGSPLVTSIWALSMAAFAWWMTRQLVRRRLVTILSAMMFLSFFLPILLQYPFAFSPINALAVGRDNYLRYQSHVDAAFLITLAGMAMFIAGYAACGRKNSEFTPLTLVGSGIRTWAQSVFLQLSSVFILLLFGLLLGLGLLGAEGARNIAQTVPALRPFYNIAHVMLPLTIALTLFVGVQRGRRPVLILGVVNLALAVLTGTRTVAFGGLLTTAMAFLVHASALQRLRVRTALKLIPAAAAVVIAAVYLGDVREGQYNLFRTVATIGVKLFYGNNLSDLRDFAWVRSYWDGEYFFGKTQLAGFLAFIPSAISSYRADWNWGVITTTMTGLDPEVNPGLRAGTFGEMYFNFGLAGVLVGAFLYGYAVRRVHNVITTAAATLPAYEARLKVLAGLVTISLVGSLLNTAGFFGFYITVAVLGGLQIIDYMVRAVRTGGAALASRSASNASPS